MTIIDKNFSPKNNPPPSFTRKLLTTVGTFALIASIFLIVRNSLNILLLIYAGVLFGIILNWLRCKITRYTRIPAGIALAVLVVVLFCTVFATIVLLAPVVAKQAVSLFEEIPGAIREFRHFLLRFNWGDTVFEKTDEPEELVLGKTREEIMEVVKGVLNLFSTTFGALFGVAFIVVIGIYVAGEMEVYFQGTLRLLPPAFRSRGALAMERMGLTLRWWLLGQCFSMLILGCSVFVGLTLMRIPYATFFALTTAAMTFIPNLGPMFAFVPIALVTLVEDPAKLIYVGIFYTIVQSVEGFFLTPMIHRKIITIPPVLIISVQVLLYHLVGFLGVLLAMPIVACAVVLVKTLYLEGFLGDERKLASIVGDSCSYERKKRRENS